MTAPKPRHRPFGAYYKVYVPAHRSWYFDGRIPAPILATDLHVGAAHRRSHRDSNHG
jgi:hypothetical protein